MSTRVVVRVSGKVVAVRGNQGSGWSASGAAVASQAAGGAVPLDVEIQYDGSGYLLCYSSADGFLYGDTWHVSQAEAEQVAQEDFGVQAHEWQRA
jgi:hypothetical protein